MSNFGGISGYLRDILKDQEKKKKATAAPKPPAPPKPPTPSYYGGGGYQAVKPYIDSAKNVAPSTPPKTTTPSTSTPTTGTPSLSQDVRNLLPSNDTPSNQSSMYPTYYKDQSGGVVSGGSSRSSSSSSSRSRSSGGGVTPTVITPKTFTPTYSAQPTGGPPPGEWSADAGTGTGVNWQSPQFIYDQYADYKSEIAALRDEELVIAARAYDQFIGRVNQLIGEYTKHYEQMGQGVDPATEAALAKLREEMSNDQRMIMEYLNARGIAQSGIAAEEVGRLAGSFADQKSQMLAQRLTDLQNQFLSSMQNFMGQAMQGMGQYTQNAMGAQQRYSQGMQGAMQNAMEKTFGAWQQEQQQRAQMEREMIPYTQGPTPYQQQQLNYQRQSQSQQAAYQKQQAQRAAQQQQAQAATNEAIARLASYPSREAAEASIRNTAPGLVQMGVDIQALYKALDMYWPRNNLDQYFNQ